MKELREYQQSEAYKMCTEKIQEKKIKKGGPWDQGQLPVARGPAKWCRGGSWRVTPFLLPRGCWLRGGEHPAERAPAQGKVLAAPRPCGEAGARGAAGFCPFGLREAWDGLLDCPLKRCLELQEAARGCPLRQGHGVPSALPDPSPPVLQAGECSDTFSTFDVPIFTEEFLDQNKGEGLRKGPSLG